MPPSRCYTTLWTPGAITASNEEGIAPYIIAHNSWLKQIVKMRPSTPKDLNEIIGFGERRVNKYGKEIIAIDQHRSDHSSREGD